MRTAEETEDMGPTITLPAVVDLAAADPLLAALRQRLAADQACDLDGSNVEKLMLPGIQVILAAIRSSAKVQVVNPSAAFCSAFDDAAVSWVRNNEAEPAQESVQEQVLEQAREQARDQVQNDDPKPDLEHIPIRLNRGFPRVG